MNVLWLFDTCGYVVGPAILAAGSAAILGCVWATFCSSTGRARRWAVAMAMAPLMLGLCGFLFGLVVVWSESLPSVPWQALGKVCLAGAAVSAVPLLWATLIVRARRDAA